MDILKRVDWSEFLTVSVKDFLKRYGNKFGGNVSGKDLPALNMTSSVTD